VVIKRKTSNRLIVIGLVLAGFLIVFFVASRRYNQEKAYSPREFTSERRPTAKSPLATNSSKKEKISTEKESKSEKKQEIAVVGSDLEFIDNEVYMRADEILGEALFDQKYSNPRNFIQLKWHEGMSYKHAKRLITKDKLPILYKMLKDKNYASEWAKVATLIGYVSDDPCSVPVLLEYIKRDDKWNWNVADRATSIGRLLGKISALIWIGKIGGEQANIILKNSATEQGAAQLAKNWIEGQLPTSVKSKEEIIDYIRSNAVMGLIYSRKPENIEIARQLFTKEEARCRKNREETEFYRGSASAIAIQDFAEENGFDTYLNFLGTNQHINAMIPYLTKYLLNFDKNGENKE
jgi:hypothetical protein